MNKTVYEAFLDFAEKKGNFLKRKLITIYKMKQLKQIDWAWMEKKELLEFLRLCEKFVDEM